MVNIEVQILVTRNIAVLNVTLQTPRKKWLGGVCEGSVSGAHCGARLSLQLDVQAKERQR